MRDAGSDGVIGSDDDRVTTRPFSVDIVESLYPWQNPTNPLDVNGDNIVGPTDVLVIINAINRHEDGPLPDRNSSVLPFYDVNGNGILEPLDALIVINAINRDSSGEGESSDLCNKAEIIDLVFQEDGSMDELHGESFMPLWNDTDWLDLVNGRLSKSRRREQQ